MCQRVGTFKKITRFIPTGPEHSIREPATDVPLWSGAEDHIVNRKTHPLTERTHTLPETCGHLPCTPDPNQITRDTQEMKIQGWEKKRRTIFDAEHWRCESEAARRCYSVKYYQQNRCRFDQRSTETFKRSSKFPISIRIGIYLCVHLCPRRRKFISTAGKHGYTHTNPLLYHHMT